MVMDDAERAQTARGALKAANGGDAGARGGGSEKAAGSGPWRAPAHEVFVVGILGTYHGVARVGVCWHRPGRKPVAVHAARDGIRAKSG